MLRNKGYSIYNFKFSLLITVMSLSLIGLVVLQAMTEDQNTSLFTKQLYGVAAGLFICIFFAFIDYHFICKLWIPLYLLNIVLMLACRFIDRSMFPYFYGKSIDEARRWIHVGGAGGTDFMPSEITKIVLIITLAVIFVKLEGRLNAPLSIVAVLLVCIPPIFLVFDQPDLSTTIVITATFLTMYFVAGLSLKLIIPALSVGIPALIFFVWYVQQDYGDNILKSWQRDRILSILNPEDYPDLMYQQNNAKAAIVSGGIFGKMISGDESARLTKYVPVVESDFIFSGVGEELGFIGSIAVIILFAVFLFISLKIAAAAKDRLGRLLAFGLAASVTLQALVNIGVVLSLLPNTGIPLPFLSSGLSSLLSNFMNVGILLNIGMQNKNVNIERDDVIVFGKYHKA